MKDFTVKQALAEAVRRWGKTAAVEKRAGLCRLLRIPEWRHGCTGWVHHPRDCQGGQPTCVVGRVVMGMFFNIEGSGYTFREAFADVDRQAAIERAKYCRRRQHHREDGLCGMCHYQGPPGRESWAQVVGKALRAEPEAQAAPQLNHASPGERHDENPSPPRR